MFDWLVLLPVVILMLVWVQDRPARNWWLLAGLIATQVLIVLSRHLLDSYNDMFASWLPLALWLLYWLGLRQQRSNQRAVGEVTS